MSRVLPILFNGDMVRAILDGRKTVTRRCIKGYIPDDTIWGYTAFTPKGHISCRGTFVDGYGEKFFKLQYQKGDILYVRETWNRIPFFGLYIYKADDAGNDGIPKGVIGHVKYKPSIHMPKEAARIWLKVTDVRVERLRDITNKEAKREGVIAETDNSGIMHRIGFAKLWESTIKKSDLDRYGWDVNPWVWVIEFERCEKPENGPLKKGLGEE